MKLARLALNGKDINLTGDNTIITSNNFNVDKNGNMSCNNATMNNANVVGGKIKLTDIPDNSDEYFILKSKNGDEFAASGSRMWLNRGTGGTAIFFQGGY